MHEQGVKKLRGTPGNLRVQVLRRVHGGVAEFMTISLLEPRDAEYLLELPREVRHYEVVADE